MTGKPRATAFLRRTGLAIAEVVLVLGLLELLACPWFAVTVFPWTAAVGTVALGAALRSRLKPPSDAPKARWLFAAALGLAVLSVLVMAGIWAQQHFRDNRRLEIVYANGGGLRILNCVPEADIVSLGAQLFGLLRFMPSDQAREVKALLRKEYRRMEQAKGMAHAGNVILAMLADKDMRPTFVFYPKDSSRPLGALLLLHGSSGPMVLYPWLMSDLADRERLIVVCPSWENGEWGNKEAAKFAIEQLQWVMKTHSVDPERVYLAGISNGGIGGWQVLDSAPHLFSGYICICGYGQPSQAKDVPILFVEGGKDVGGVTQKDVNDCAPLSRLVVFPDDDHFVMLRSNLQVTDAICEWMISLQTPNATEYGPPALLKAR